MPDVSLLARRRSLQMRVTLAATGLIAAVLIVGALSLAVLLRRALEQDSATLLNEQIDDVATLARAGDLPSTLQAKGRETGQLQVLDASGTVLASTTGIGSTTRLDLIAAPDAEGATTGNVSGEQIDSDDGERYRIVARTVDTDDGRLFIYGVSSLRAADGAVTTLALALLAGVPMIAALAGWVLWRSIGRALAPVDAMRAEVDEIEASSLERRISVPAGDDELARLAGTLNHLLDRLDEDAQTQRRFAADASHELRSPLSAARIQLEVGLTYPSRTDWPATATDVLIEIDRLERLSRELLDFARTGHDPAGPARRALDLGALVDRAVATTPATTSASAATIAWRPPAAPVWVVGDDDLLTRVLRNLLDNAVRHAEARIDVDIRARRDHVEVRVANDGPAIGDDDRERIFLPFTRLDAARTADAGGAGLGLAIARRIAIAHGGALTADAVPEGASFTLRLPSAAGTSVPDGRAMTLAP